LGRNPDEEVDDRFLPNIILGQERGARILIASSRAMHFSACNVGGHFPLLMESYSSLAYSLRQHAKDNAIFQSEVTMCERRGKGLLSTLGISTK